MFDETCLVHLVLARRSSSIIRIIADDGRSARGNESITLRGPTHLRSCPQQQQRLSAAVVVVTIQPIIVRRCCTGQRQGRILATPVPARM